MMNRFFRLSYLPLLFCIPVQAAFVPVLPELPRAWVDTIYQRPAGNTIAVHQGDDLQDALDKAQPGDTVEIDAGATFVGSFKLKNKGASTNWIYIQSSAYDALPKPNLRVSPADAPSMPKLLAPVGNAPAISTEDGAHHYRIVGIEVSSDQNFPSWELIYITGGDGTSNHPQVTMAQVPHHIIIDRCYIHGNGEPHTEGIILSAAHAAVVDTYIGRIERFMDYAVDCSAIIIYNGPGPYKIVNNYLEASAINLFVQSFGTTPELQPADLEIRHNHIAKPESWWPGSPNFDGKTRWVKNLFEMKGGTRALIDGNIFDYSWFGSQHAFSLVMTVRGNDSTHPIDVNLGDITITNNVIRHSGAGIEITGYDNTALSTTHSENYLIRDNVWEDIHPKYSEGGSLGGMLVFMQTGPVANTIIDHNTFFNYHTIDYSGGALYFQDGAPKPGFAFTNNIFSDFGGGVASPFASGVEPVFNHYFPDGSRIFQHNVVPGGGADLNWDKSLNFMYQKETHTYLPDTMNDVGFVNFNNGSGGNYRLAASSPYKAVGVDLYGNPDGSDPGANIDAVQKATLGVLSGQYTEPDLPAPDLSSLNGKTASVSTLHVTPNPYRKGRHSGGITFANGPAKSSIKIFTISGRLVRKLDGDGPLVWNLKNETGEDVSSGIYVYLLESPDGQKIRGKLAVIK